MSRTERSGRALHVKVLHEAANKAGGVPSLAKHLHAPLQRVQRWACGDEPTPQVYFVRAVDILTAEPEDLPAADPLHPRVWMCEQTRRAFLHDQQLQLPLTEWAVLESLAARIGRVVAREQIRRELSLWTGKGLSDALQMHVFRLRLKVEPAGFFIRTFHRMGYMLQDGWLAA